MIRVKKNRGKKIGDHFIFADITEAKKYLSGELASYNTNGQNLDSAFCFKHWADRDVVEDDWVIDETGKVAQVISHYIMDGKKSTKPTPNVVVHCIKTIGALGYYTEYVDGEKKGTISYKYGLQINEKSMESSFMRNSMGRMERPILGVSFNMWKMLFVYYLVIYMSPVVALKIVIKQKGIKYKYKYKQLIIDALGLLKEPKVIKELGKYMSNETFREKMLKSLDDANLNEERIANELVNGLAHVKPGTHSHLEFIQTVANLRRHAMDNENVDANGKQIGESKLKVLAEPTNFDLLPEPPKKIADNIDESTKLLVDTLNGEEIDKGMMKMLNDKLKKEGKTLDDVLGTTSNGTNGDDV